MMTGIFLSSLGLLYLLKNTGYLPNPAWSVTWPAVLLAFGLVSITRRFIHWPENSLGGWGLPMLLATLMILAALVLGGRTLQLAEMLLGVTLLLVSIRRAMFGTEKDSAMYPF